MIRSFILISFIFLANIVFGQSKVFKGKEVSKVEYNALDNIISKYDIYEIDATAMHKYFTSANPTSITLELGTKFSFNLDLRENKIFKPGIKSRVVTENGIEQGTISTIKCFQGNVHGTNQIIALSVDKDFLSGLITEAGNVLYFEPLSYLVPGAPDNYFVFYHAEDYNEKKPFKCMAMDAKNYMEKLDKKLKNGAGKAEFAPLGCKEVEIAEASDKSMCTHYGSTTNVQNRITSIINDVQTNYCCNFNDNLTLIISDWFNVACNGTDPWTSSTDAAVLLDDFTNWAPSHFGSHDVGELYSFRDFDGGTVGIAWVGTVCSDAQYNCIQDWTTNSNLIRVTVAHEIGHNFNCDHDPQGNTIMAPVVNNTNNWSGLSISTFNSFVPTLNCLSACTGGQAPDPDFTSDNTGGCRPKTVHFTDQSANTPTSWAWSFPGGSPATSSAKNPTVVYNTIGTYNVTLVATNSFGSNSITKTNYITIIDKPIVDFTYVKNQGVVQFTNTSVNGVNYNWNFGDGEFSTEENPQHEYTDPGTYTVTLTVTNDCGTNSKTQNIVIVFVPLANFSSNVTQGCSPLTVSYSDESTNFPTSWLWTFPGGTPSSSTLQNPTVVYNNAGDFDVTLVATNSAGSNSITIAKYMKVKSVPAANFSYSINGYTVNFTNNTTGTGNTYLWNFGDGNTSNEVSPSHIYALPGDFTVSLTVTNSCGSNTSTKVITVLALPKAAFSSDVTVGCSALTVHFNDLSTNNPTSWKWTFPGGSPSSSTIKNPIIVYNNPGQYDVSLIASNGVGSDTIVKSNYINVITIPTASFTSSINGNVVTFNNTSTYGNTYLWNFGDGNTSTQINPVHTYSQENTYTVSLTVTNACGTNTVTHTVTIVFPPTAGFSANITSGCEPLTVVFNNTTSNNATYFNWSFPGGTPGNSTLMNPTVVYSTAGSYAVTLIAGNSAGADTLSFSNYINVQSKPVSSFNYSNNNGITIFNNTTIGGTSYKWLFGDGDSSIVKNPTHIYGAEGSYTVKLTATNACGTTVITQLINVVFPPIANFSSDFNSGCNNLTINFQDLSSSGTTSWNWSFPGGSPATSSLKNPVVTYSSPGLYDVKLIATNSGGSDTIVKPGFVLISTVPPVANFNYTNFGISYNFNNLSLDASSYSWHFGDGGISNEKNPLHNYEFNGSYTVQLVAFNGCGSDTFLLGVNVVGIPPVASFEANITDGCLPLTVNFKDNSLGGANSWNWSFPGGDPVSSTEQNPTVIYNTAGTFLVQLIAGNNFGKDTVTTQMYIHVKGVPNAQFNYTSQGNLVKFNNTSTGGTTYLWNFGDGMTSNLENPNHSYAAGGKYTVTLTVTNECGSFTFTQTVDVKVGVNEIGFLESMSIYPNPNTGVFNIKINSKQKAIIELKVIDLIGRVISISNLELNEGFNSKEIAVENASSGQYFVILRSETHVAVEKIIIE